MGLHHLTFTTGDRPGGNYRAAMPSVDPISEQLLRAASDVLATEGPAALTVRRVATEAGVSTMNVYSRFGSKEGLVQRLYLEGFQRLHDAMAAIGSTDDPIEDLSGCGDAYRTFALNNPTYYSVMFDAVIAGFEPSDDARQQASATLEHLAGRLRRAMELGRLTAADPLQTAAAVWSVTHGVMTLWMKNVGPPGIDWAQVYEEATSALFLGLGVH